MTIFSKKEQVENALVKVINAAIKLDAHDRAKKTSLEEKIGTATIYRGKSNVPVIIYF